MTNTPEKKRTGVILNLWKGKEELSVHKNTLLVRTRRRVRRTVLLGPKVL